MKATPSIWRDLLFGEVAASHEVHELKIPRHPALGRHGKQRMIPTAVKLDWILIERLVNEPRPVLVEHADAQPDPAIQDGAFDLVGRQRVDAECHKTPAVFEVRQGAGEWRARVGDPIVDDGDRKLADQLAAHRAYFGAEGFQRVEQLLTGFVDHTPLVGEAEPNPAALAEPHAQARFQVAHVAADGRLAEIEGDLGRREAARLHHRHEDRKQMQVGLGKPADRGRARRVHT
jgi:hypothetical protein